VDRDKTRRGEIEIEIELGSVPREIGYEAVNDDSMKSIPGDS
jgi:hypothetical protein